jgi:hypothetical protein
VLCQSVSKKEGFPRLARPKQKAGLIGKNAGKIQLADYWLADTAGDDAQEDGVKRKTACVNDSQEGEKAAPENRGGLLRGVRGENRRGSPARFAGNRLARDN